jgi:hypothetical protein
MGYGTTAFPAMLKLTTAHISGKPYYVLGQINLREKRRDFERT